MIFSPSQSKDLKEINISTLIIGICFVLPTIYCESVMDDESIEMWSRIIVGSVSTVAIIGVVFYHLTTSPHPKFTMSLKRKICIRLHVASGTLEILSSLIAIIVSGLFSWNVTFFGKTQALMAIIHVVTAFIQTPIVFGAKGIMVPGYYYTSILHAFYACKSWLNPNSLSAIVDTYFVLNIFTYVRVYIKLLYHNNIGSGNEYSIASILAVLTMLPFVIGPGGVFFFILVVALNGELIRYLMGVNAYHPKYLAVIHEHDRYTVFNKEAVEKWQGPSNGRSDEAHARDLFDSIDIDKSGTIDQEEVLELLNHFHVKKCVVDSFIALLTKNNGSIGFDIFYKHIWKSKTFVKPDIKFAEVIDDEKKARIMFECIDVDGDNSIDAIELSKLLSEWGCPDDEVIEYIKRYDTNGDGIFSFEEFFTQMRELWSYGFQNLVDQEKIEENMETQLIKYHQI